MSYGALAHSPTPAESRSSKALAFSTPAFRSINMPSTHRPIPAGRDATLVAGRKDMRNSVATDANRSRKPKKGNVAPCHSLCARAADTTPWRQHQGMRL